MVEAITLFCFNVSDQKLPIPSTLVSRISVLVDWCFLLCVIIAALDILSVGQHKCYFHSAVFAYGTCKKHNAGAKL